MIEKNCKIRYWKLTPRMCNDNDMDVIIEIKSILRRLVSIGPLIEFKYVKAHQDRDQSVLDTSAKMNIRADELATAGLQLKNLNQQIIFPSDNATISLKGKHITSNCKKGLKSAHQSINLRNYLKESNNWNDNQVETIWWKIHKKALSTIKNGKSMIIKKFLHSHLPCNYKNNQM